MTIRATRRLGISGQNAGNTSAFRLGCAAQARCPVRKCLRSDVPKEAIVSIRRYLFSVITHAGPAGGCEREERRRSNVVIMVNSLRDSEAADQSRAISEVDTVDEGGVFSASIRCSRRRGTFRVFIGIDKPITLQ
jgi:hypothetical protein